MTREKQIILSARVVSMIFTPFYLPLVGMVALFLFSYLSQLPLWFQLQLLILIYLFTILLPTLLIRAYRKMQGWTRIQLGQKERRMVPYLISILCYFLCIEVMSAQNIFYFIHSIIFSALLIQISCILINFLWKISIHMAAIGALAGGLLAFTHTFIYNPIWWLCLVLLLAGLLGTARMILRQHTLAQVVAGFGVGFLCAVVGILREHFPMIVEAIFRIIFNSLLKLFL